jgi:hypothetical protein
MNLYKLIKQRLFYILPLSIKQKIIRNQWSGDLGSDWHRFHYSDRKTTGDPLGWENRKDVIEYMLNKEVLNHEKIAFIDYGCGNALFTQHIQSKSPDNYVFFGYDINDDIIESNKLRFSEIKFFSKDFYNELNGYDKIIIYFGSTLAYMEFNEIENVLLKFANVGASIFLIATDTIKGRMPVYRTNR